MRKKTTELFTPYTQQAALAESRPPQTVMVINLNGRLHVDAFGRWWPCFGPAWL